jgi:hypothetical protein
MIIDAMDILHDNTVDGFVIVSSDSDYTRLAIRIREEGMFVMGIGRRSTALSLQKACDVFVYTENLGPEPAARGAQHAPARRQSPAAKSQVTGDAAAARKLILEAYETAETEDGWVDLGTLGMTLRKLDPAFDPRTYGFSMISKLIRSYGRLFEVKSREGGGALIRLTAETS